ncbi:hypothetical protein [Mycolicibacterium austroafricanum]|uniref:hypothetical protein n=1 Tax=Mycolicibacterium austroafricanum TaxID=39687 RepID=UPI001CA3575F|nr:hypothetical protein [Mycolicibacterium austroafricanum]QZT62515.1 hypothetical protein JN085_27210 [Mycolicibacterium austroafricanum]
MSLRGWLLFAAMGVIWGIPYLPDGAAPGRSGADPRRLGAGDQTRRGADASLAAVSTD